MPFNILVLCTGNICRSPVGELLLQHYLDDSVQVTSAGTGALAGNPVEQQMRALLPRSIDAAVFVARQLRPRMVREADLVLAMTRTHRSAAVELVPAALRRTFTLREFARLLRLPDVIGPRADPADFLRAAIPVAAAKRSLVRVGDPALDDVPDPYRRGDAAFARAYTQIDQATREIAAACGLNPAA